MTEIETSPAPDVPTFPATDPGQIEASVKLEATTLADLGAVLPASRKPYRFHRPSMGTLKRLGQLKADKGLAKRPGLYVAHYLGAALAELGGEDMGAPERNDASAARVLDLPVGDVLTLLIAWQHEQTKRQGANLGSAGCGACGAVWESVRVDLSELEVLAVPDGHQGPPTARVGLWDGFPAGKLHVSAVLVQPPTWGESLGQLSREAWGNPEAVRAATIQGAIKGCDALPKIGRLSAEWLDELMPDDLDLIDQALAKITPSVELAVSIPCPDCGASNATAMDWRTLGFTSGPARP